MFLTPDSETSDSRLLSRVFDGLDDVLVAGAAAEVSVEAVAYLFARRVCVAFEELRGGHDHAGRAVAALQAMSLPEPLLNRVQLAVLRESFDGRDARAVGLDGEHRAGLDGLAVNRDGASAAQRSLAADVRARQSEHVAQVVHEQQSRLDFRVV